jgi:hypothetical protein
MNMVASEGLLGATVTEFAVEFAVSDSHAP